MAVVLHMTAKEGSRLWHGFAGQDGSVFSRGGASKPEPYSVEVSSRYRDFSPTMPSNAIPEIDVPISLRGRLGQTHQSFNNWLHISRITSHLVCGCPLGSGNRNLLRCQPR